MSSDWNWNDPESVNSTVVPAVQAVAVYTNPKGEIVIRQQDTFGDPDSIIVVPRVAAKALAKALNAEVAKPFTPDE